MLTANDIEQVRTAGMSPAIAATADRVAAVYCGSTESRAERTIAEDIIAIWLKAAAREVREALARQLRHCPFLPRKLALEMAGDLDSVAVPMLQLSEVFTDSDLCEIVRCSDVGKQMAVATRQHVSYDVADALVGTQNEDVVTALVRNDGARLTQGLLHQIVDTYVDSQPIHEGLVHRAALPISIAERLITVVTDNLRGHLVERFQMPQELADGLANITREAATSSSLPPQASAEIASVFVDHLDASKRLTSTFMLRTLCDGQAEIFKAALGRRAGLSLDSVGRALRVGGREQQSNLFLRAGIPSLLIPAFRAAVDVIINDEETSDMDVASERQIRDVINRIVRQYEEIDPKDLESVLMRLSQMIHLSASKRCSASAAVPPNGSPDRSESRAEAWGPCGSEKGSTRVGLGNDLIVTKRLADKPTRH